jgi:hypothetical protein
MFVALLVVLASGAGWVLSRDFAGPLPSVVPPPVASAPEPVAPRSDELAALTNTDKPAAADPFPDALPVQENVEPVLPTVAPPDDRPLQRPLESAQPPRTPAPPLAAASTAATAFVAVPAAPVSDVDNSAIRDAIGRYQKAFNALDAQAAHQAWPTVTRETLDRAFGQLMEQRLTFDSCSVAVKGILAEANCSGTTRFVPASGSRLAQTAQRRWKFSLRKGDESAWLIQHVEAR